MKAHAHKSDIHFINGSAIKNTDSNNARGNSGKPEKTLKKDIVEKMQTPFFTEQDKIKDCFPHDILFFRPNQYLERRFIN
jgi:hypothetical protein